MTSTAPRTIFGCPATFTITVDGDVREITHALIIDGVAGEIRLDINRILDVITRGKNRA